jgi:hypothetical protein
MVYHRYNLGALLQKGGSTMSFIVTFDWKLAVALGGVAVGIIFAVKIDSAAIERVSVHAIDTFGKYAVAVNNNC